MADLKCSLEEFRNSLPAMEYYYFQTDNLILTPPYSGLVPLNTERFQLYERNMPKGDPLRAKFDFGDVKHYDLEALKALTDDFDQKNLIQKIYRGRLFRARILTDDGLKGREVTVKKWDFFYPLDTPYTYYPIEFYREVQFSVLGEMKHKNIVNVIGFLCEKYLAVVYDLECKQCVHDAIPTDAFDWNARMRVAIEMAQLLKYMHDREVTICTISAKNIMIDKKGSFKLFEINPYTSEQENDEDDQPTRTRLRGGYGVIAPEAFTGPISIKTDTFAYGVLLLELISRQAFDYKIGRIAILKELKAIKGSYVDASFPVDDNIGSEITHLALTCTDEDPSKRPEMGQVIECLEKLYGHLDQPIKKPKTGDYQFNPLVTDGNAA